jgi:glycosyltransferase involved in cell wall biosynthesis
MRVAIVHDDLVQWGGAERVLLGIAEVFPQAPIYTSVFNRQSKNLRIFFKDKKIITSFLQKIPFWNYFYKALLPLYPLSFEQFDFSQYDLVISQTTRFAKSVITGPKTIHICYCHTPPRFLWNFSGEKISNWLLILLTWLRLYDRISAQRVDLFWAGSENAKQRIKKVYQKDSEILLPFVDLEKFQEALSYSGDYYLVIARLNFYKRVDLAVKVCKKTGRKLKIIGVGPERENLLKLSNKDIELLGGLNEDILLSVLAGCRGLIVTAQEDFGLTPLEAQAVGKGVIAFGMGGALETVLENKTGVFFDAQTEESLEKALNKFESLRIDPKDCKENAAKFSKENFKQNLSKLVEQAQNMLP